MGQGVRLGLLMMWIAASGAASAATGMAADAGADSTRVALRTVDHVAVSAPADVPIGYVITPVGYFHPSCVRQVGADETVNMRSGNVERAGVVQRASAPCNYPHYTADGLLVPVVGAQWTVSDGDERADIVAAGIAIEADTLFVGTFDFYTGWVESIWAHPAVAGAVSYQQVDFTVPAAPPAPNSSTNFFFPGLESLDQTPQHGTILQPVLGWNAYGNLHAWTIASWNCCVDGNVNASNYIVVHTGDVIRGTTQGSGCSATTHICSQWAITTKDVTTNQSVTLNTAAYGQAFNWVFGGASEVYDVASCADISASDYVDFTNMVTRNVAGQTVLLDYVMDTPSASVQCGFNIYTLTDKKAYRLTF